MPLKETPQVSNVLRLFVSAVFLWGVAYTTISANVPKIYSPYSFAVVIPLFSLYEVFGGRAITFALATLAIPVLFVFWSFPLLKGQERIPKRTKILAALLVLLSFIALAASWSYGIQYQGIGHTVAMYLFNLGCWAILFVLLRNNARQASYTSNFLFHWTLFAWLAWVAFPWLGELI